MIYRGALVYRLPQYRLAQYRPVRLPVRLVQIRLKLSVVVILLECRARFSFRRLRRVLLNVRRVFRWMTILGVRESFVDVSRALIPRRARVVHRLPQTGQTLVHQTVVHGTMIRPTLVLLTLVRQIVVARRIVNGRTLFRHRTSSRDRLKRRRRVQLFVPSRDLMSGPGVLCDLQWVKARNAYAVSKESKTTHEAKTTREASAPIHLNA